MTGGQRTSFSLLFSMIFFAAFIYVAQMGLMQHLETKFYSSAKISEKQQYVDKIAKSSESYISNILTKIETGDTAYLKQEAVKSYIEQNPSEKAEIDRRNLTTKLIEDIPSLTGIRLIDINGRNIHYSSFEKDVLNQNGIKKQYKNYPDIQNEFNELEISTILSDSNLPQRKILFDKKQNRLIISFPFFISNNVCFASLVCYFDLLMYEQFLVEKEIIPFGENLTLVDNENLFGGYVIGIPKNNRSEFIKPILNNWTNQQTNKTLPTMILESNDLSWYLLNSSQNPYFNISSVYDAWSRVKNSSVITDTENGTITLAIKLVNSVVACDNSGKTTVLENEHTLEHKFRCKDITDKTTVIPDVDVISVTYNIDDNGNIELKCEVRICINIRRIYKFDAVTEIKIDDTCEKKQEDYALKMYFADEGETLWDIAKKYSTSIEAIMEENDCPENCGKILLIPIVS